MGMKATARRAYNPVLDAGIDIHAMFDEGAELGEERDEVGPDQDLRSEGAGAAGEADVVVVVDTRVGTSGTESLIQRDKPADVLDEGGEVLQGVGGGVLKDDGIGDDGIRDGGIGDGEFREGGSAHGDVKRGEIEHAEIEERAAVAAIVAGGVSATRLGVSTEKNDDESGYAGSWRYERPERAGGGIPAERADEVGDVVAEGFSTGDDATTIGRGDLGTESPQSAGTVAGKNTELREGRTGRGRRGRRLMHDELADVVELTAGAAPACGRYLWHIEERVFRAADEERVARGIPTWGEYFIAVLAQHARELDAVFPSLGYDLTVFGIGPVARRGYRRGGVATSVAAVYLPKSEQGRRIAEVIETYAARARSKSVFAQTLLEHHLSAVGRSW